MCELIEFALNLDIEESFINPNSVAILALAVFCHHVET